MRITCVGGGPAGLYFAIAARALDPGHEITVLERRPPGSTYGWGIVYWDDLLEGVRRVDPPAARAIRAGSIRWPGQQVAVQGRPPVHLGGTGYGMSRRRLIDVLTTRAVQLGVDVRFEHDVDDLPSGGADLVVLADGANSRLRRARAAAFGTTERLGGNRHIWLGSTEPFDDFTFAFERTAAGWIWCHAYRYQPDASTVIVECSRATWEALGFDAMDDDDCLAGLERIFARHLGGHRLRNRTDDQGGRSAWTAFPTVTNARWYDGPTVLIGDSAHTSHFSIGSGTRLAFEDAAALARALRRCPPAHLTGALQAYEDLRRPAVLAVQDAARCSAGWFEHVDQHMRLPDLEFGLSLRLRRTVPPGEEIDVSWTPATLHRLTQWQLGRTARRVVSTSRRAVEQHRRPRATTAAPPPARTAEPLDTAPSAGSGGRADR
jgi:anthraniloyl-CoA monooxygenase